MSVERPTSTIRHASGAFRPGADIFEQRFPWASRSCRPRFRQPGSGPTPGSGNLGPARRFYVFSAKSCFMWENQRFSSVLHIRNLCFFGTGAWRSAGPRGPGNGGALARLQIPALGTRSGQRTATGYQKLCQVS